MTPNMNIEKQLRAMSAHTPSPVLDMKRLNSGIEKHQKIIRLTKTLSAMAAAIVLIVGAVIITSAIARNRILSTVTVDTDARFTLNINRNGQVVSVTAGDQRAKKALSDYHPLKQQADAEIANLTEYLIDNGYLNEYDNTVLITADSEDDDVAEDLRDQTAQAVEDAYADSGFNGAVLSQTADNSDKTRRLSSHYHVSLGKARLMRELIEADNTMSYRSLSRMSVNDLNLIADSIDLDYTDITESGVSSDLGYLEEGEAIRIVIDHLDDDTAKTVHIRFDARNGELIYRLSIIAGKNTYTYNLVASSGEIITVIKSGGGKTEILIDNKSRTAPDDDDAEPYIPPVNDPVTPPSATQAPDQPDEPSPTQSAPVVTPTQSPNIPEQPATSSPTSAEPVQPSTESDRGDVPDSISFTSSEYYRCSSNLLDTGYSMPPWSTPPESSYIPANAELFRGVYYESKAVSGQQFNSGSVAFICNTTQLKNFLSDHGRRYSESGESFDISGFTDSYFQSKSLILTTYDLQNYNYSFYISEMRINGDTLYLNTAMQQTTGLPTTTYLAHDLTAYEIDRTALERVAQVTLF